MKTWDQNWTYENAIGCQKDIAKKIIEKEAHYVLAVKKNQGRLLEEIEDTAKLEKPDSIYTETSGDAYVRTIP